MGSYENSEYALGLGYVDPSDVGTQQLRQMMDYFYNANYPGQAALWAQGAIDKRFKVGDQSLYNMMFGNNSQNMQRISLNLIRRHLDMINGYQRRNRKSTVALPIHYGDDSLSDDYNMVFRYCEDRSGFQEYFSQLFEGSNDTGMTLLHMYLDYSKDPYSGDLCDEPISYNNFLIDQYFRKQDLSDCNGIYRRRWTSKQGAKLLLPGYAKEIDRMKPGGMRDGRFPMQAELQNLPMNGLFAFDEFFYRTTRSAKMILDPHTGEAVEWEKEEGDTEDTLNQVLRFQPWLQVKEMQIPTVNLTIALGNKIVYNGRNLLSVDEYPFAVSLCHYEPDIPNFSWRCQGKIRNMRDAQWLYSLRKVIELQILQSSINSGWIYEVDAVADPKALRQASGGDGFLVGMKTGRMDAVKRIEPIAIPPTLLELSRILAEDITKISGVNEELLGAATDDKAGILSMLRQGAGLTTLQGLFDRLDYCQSLYGSLRLKAVQKNYTKHKIRNILGREPNPNFFSSYAQKYSIQVGQGNYSITQRQMELEQLLNFKQIGMPIPDKSILEAAFITNKKEITDQMQQDAQAQIQVQSQQAQMEQQKQQAEIGSELAKQKELLASAQEKISKINESQASAEHKRTEADLNLVKMMIELDDLDLQNFRNALELAEEIRIKNQEGELYG